MGWHSVPRGGILLHLGENPGIGRRGTADHHGVASGFFDDARGIFGRLNVAVADHGNLHGLLYGGDDFPVGAAGVALLAGARVHGNGFDADAFGEFCYFDGNDGVFVPTGAQFDGEWNADGGADGAEDLLEQARSRSRPEPPHFTTFLAGQPRLMSTAS